MNHQEYNHGKSGIIMDSCYSYSFYSFHQVMNKKIQHLCLSK